MYELRPYVDALLIESCCVWKKCEQGMVNSDQSFTATWHASLLQELSYMGTGQISIQNCLGVECSGNDAIVTFTASLNAFQVSERLSSSCDWTDHSLAGGKPQQTRLHKT